MKVTLYILATVSLIFLFSFAERTIQSVDEVGYEVQICFMKNDCIFDPKLKEGSVSVDITDQNGTTNDTSSVLENGIASFTVFFTDQKQALASIADKSPLTQKVDFVFHFRLYSEDKSFNARRVASLHKEIQVKFSEIGALPIKIPIQLPSKFLKDIQYLQEK